MNRIEQCYEIERTEDVSCRECGRTLTDAEQRIDNNFRCDICDYAAWRGAAADTTSAPITVQRQLSNGAWIDLSGDLAEKFINMALATEPRMSRIEKRAQLMTAEQVKKHLADTGKTLRYDSDWYAKIRAMPAQRVEMSVVLVAADCGHKVAREQLMNASMGTSCPNCYDRMSD